MSLSETRTSAGPDAAASTLAGAFPLDKKGFAKIHRDYGDRLIQSITGLVRDRDKAEEIMARTFQLAWEKREGFRGEALPTTWIEAIARCEAQQLWSRNQSARFDSIDGADARGLPAPELVTHDLERRDDLSRLQKAFDRLRQNAVESCCQMVDGSVTLRAG